MMTPAARDNWQFVIGVFAALVLLAVFIIAIHLAIKLRNPSLPPTAVRSLISPARQQRLTACVVC